MFPIIQPYRLNLHQMKQVITQQQISVMMNDCNNASHAAHMHSRTVDSYKETYRHTREHRSMYIHSLTR